jgi:hypothetical protein
MVNEKVNGFKAVMTLKYYLIKSLVSKIWLELACLASFSLSKIWELCKIVTF